ncbi:aminodeoxychorismate synthase component I [Tsuneonella flava]|uniref:Probable branched-chain-amino-acid aminotransferase n=1 Tax=Tsuneonella flava TaxID=2055955 RepID=A0ABX7K9M8_9SPHN|nr:aminodeoxychorismate synthase component I [Tsuneonella flava]QSB44940.1 aminodeoxychorismate synthase component I [Tsuneonella flava]
MGERSPFVLLDDARDSGAASARHYSHPRAVFVAYRPAEVASVLEAAETARISKGGILAGYIAFEAGLALEPRLAPLADARSGAAGPLVWLGLFDAEETISANRMPDWLEANSDAGASLGPLDPQLSTGGYIEAFGAMQNAIQAGDIYQANLTFPVAGSYRGDPLALYAALRRDAKAGYGGVVFDGQRWLLSLSPELFVSLKGQKARVKPMKGTRPRGHNLEEDHDLAEELAHSEKDKAENLMIVDLMRNDLSRVAVPGSVRVESPFTIESYPTVHQMVSTVEARLAPGMGTMDLVRAMFPCGSVTGAPKIRAIEMIASVERDARGPYCGAIGRIGPDGDAAFNVAIRTLRLSEIENGQGTAVLGLGSAIVADSEALSEWREGILKGDFARRSASAFDLIETMRFDPEAGIELLELHLERIKASAEEFGFSFDRHAARNQIQALCFDLDAVSKVRLLVARSGAMGLEASPLPEAPERPLTCAILPLPVNSGDWRLRHKTTDRAFYDAAREVARDTGADEALLLRDDGLLTEGSFTSLFIERRGMLLTPPASLGLLPGVQRRHLIEQGRAREENLTIDDLADGFFIGNAVRGLMPARLME